MLSTNKIESQAIDITQILLKQALIPEITLLVMIGFGLDMVIVMHETFVDGRVGRLLLFRRIRVAFMER